MTSPLTSPYRPLFTYLDRRFADNVVLTFAEIEDLLGFPLPEQAHLQAAWWTGGSDSVQSAAWTGAKRTAEPSLRAHSVAFPRMPDR
ncbi:MAG: hypothetical protein ABI634_14700 [Acidobacteriota bacterium]